MRRSKFFHQLKLLEEAISGFSILSDILNLKPFSGKPSIFISVNKFFSFLCLFKNYTLCSTVLAVRMVRGPPR